MQSVLLSGRAAWISRAAVARHISATPTRLGPLYQAKATATDEGRVYPASKVWETMFAQPVELGPAPPVAIMGAKKEPTVSPHTGFAPVDPATATNPHELFAAAMAASLADGIAQAIGGRGLPADMVAQHTVQALVGVGRDATQLTTGDAPAEAVASHILISEGSAAEQVAKCEEIKQALQGASLTD
jgi:hypothetical protein